MTNTLSTGTLDLVSAVISAGKVFAIRTDTGKPVCECGVTLAEPLATHSARAVLYALGITTSMHP